MDTSNAVSIPHCGLRTKSVFEVYKWERESPSHPVGSELLSREEVQSLFEKSPFHTVGLEQITAEQLEQTPPPLYAKSPSHPVGSELRPESSHSGVL